MHHQQKWTCKDRQDAVFRSLDGCLPHLSALSVSYHVQCMEISWRSSLMAEMAVAIGLGYDRGLVGHLTAGSSILVLEAQSKSRLWRQLGECYVDGGSYKKEGYLLHVAGGLIFEVCCAYSKIGPLPNLGHVYCWKRGTYFREGTV